MDNIEVRAVIFVLIAVTTIWMLFKVTSKILEQRTILTIEVDGLKVVWKECGFTGAIPLIYQWKRGKWEFVQAGNTTARCNLELTVKEEVERITRTRVNEVVKWRHSWGEAPLNRRNPKGVLQ